jgi:hypothetical protein
MTRIFLACAFLTVSVAAQAQTTKPQSPGEIAAASRMMAEKRADCQKQAKDKKLKLMERRKFVKECVKH